MRRNVDSITRATARRNIIGLGLPPIVLDVFDEKPVPPLIHRFFCYPYEVFVPDQQEFYGEGPITPVWSDSSHACIVAYHHEPRREGFFRFSLEGDEELPFGLSWQQILVAEFKFMWECELDAEEMRRAAELFDFRYVEELIRELSDTPSPTFEADNRWYLAFLDKILQRKEGW